MSTAGTTVYNSQLTNNLDASGRPTGAQTTVYTATPPGAASPTAPVTPVTPAPPTAPVVDVSKPLNASAIQGATPTTYPAPVTTNTTAANSQLGATTSGQGITAASSLAQPPAQTPAASTDRSSALNSILEIFKKQQNQGADTAAAQKENDVAGKQQKVTDINNELASKTAAWDAQIETARKNLGGGGQAGVDAQVQQLEQQKNQDLANISIRLNAATGNYQTAAAIAKETVDAKYAPLKDQIDTLTKYYQLSSNDMTESEKQQSQAVIDQKKAEYAAKTDKELAQYRQQLEQSDPLHQAQVAEAWAGVAHTNALTNQANQTAAATKTLNGKPQTAVQTQVQGYADRTNQSDVILSKIGNEFTGAGSVVGQILPNVLKSSDRQQYEQAQRDFVNAVLRRESGAAISSSEFTNAKNQYFPQPGDGAAVIAQKAANRQTVINNLYQQSNTQRGALPGQIIESEGKQYQVGDDGVTLTEI